MPKKKKLKKEVTENLEPVVADGKMVLQPIVQEMESSYLDYAMSVIISRALPDVRDGLKPVHRRILYAMWTEGLRHTARFRKSATVVGTTLGRYHPHGDMAVYDAMVRMAQDFSMRYPLVEGQGNFGCFTGDTKIKLLDNTERSFEQLAKDFGAKKKFAVYSVNNKGEIVVGWARNSRITRRKAEVIELTLNTGEKIRCTPDHRFLLRNGKYKAAKDLTSKDSLMSRTNYYEFQGTLVPSVAQTFRSEVDSKSLRSKDLSYTVPKASLERIRGVAMNGAGTKFLSYVKEKRTQDICVVRRCVIKQQSDVWDITVDEYHNFLLADGVFVHNSVDGDSAAAQRYTEARLASISEELLQDIERDTVDFMPNYDSTHQEPRVLPGKLPNLLLNGTVGIAVGMATNIPPHNLTELCDGVTTLIADPDASVSDLAKLIKGPDFPTGGIIYNTKDITHAYASGRGPIVMRAKTDIQEDKTGAFRIIVSEIPYQVNKSNLLQKMAELVRDKKVEGIRDLRDESSKEGLRIVIELKKDAYPKKVLNRLFQTTQLQETFHVNMLALVDGIQPRVLNLKMVLAEYIKHRQQVVRRRAEHDLTRAKERAHILEGLKKALLKIDRIISTIKKSRDRDAARVNLIKKFKLTEIQANAILDMRLAQLAALERLKIETELKEKKALIKDLEALLKSPKQILGVIRKETEDLKKKHGDERRTKVVAGGVKEFAMEDVIPNEQAIIMITRDGYVKRLPPDTFKRQQRGGKGVIGLTTKEEDVVDELLVTMTHADVLLFTTRGRVFQLKAYDIPQTTRTAKGTALVNFLQLGPGEKVSATLSLSDLKEYKYLMMTTKQGTIKKTDLSDFEAVRRSGLIAIKLREEDTLQWVKPTSGNDEAVLVSAKGQAIRFKEKDVRAMGRVASGVRGVRLGRGDSVVSMDIVDPEMVRKGLLELLVVSGHGFGKRSNLKHFKVQRRGGSGIKTAKVTSKTGEIVYAQVSNATDERDLIVVSEQGQVIRLPFGSIPVLGRATQGVRIMRFKEEKDGVASVTFI